MKKTILIAALILGAKTFVGQVGASGNSINGSQTSGLGANHVLFGNQNTVSGNTNYAEGSHNFVTGYANTVGGAQNIVSGYSNFIYSYSITPTTGKTTSGSIISGISNKLVYKSDGSTAYHETTGSGVFGAVNAVGGQYCYAFGLRTLAGVTTYTANTYTGNTISNAFAMGMNVTASANNSIMIGSGLYDGSNTAHGKDVVNSTANSLAITFSKQSGSYTPLASRPTFFVGEADQSLSDASYAKYGTVGIGTNDTKGHTLGVRGDIIAEKIQVALYSGNWPDYVFSKEYKLSPIARLEGYIKQNNHLPNLPCAAEVEQNGYDLADMDAKLLEKIEELTLYMIEMNKQLEALKKENEALKLKLEK